jgi:hypothetical protein
MFTVEVAEALGLRVETVGYYEKLFALGVERRCGRLWWTEEKVQLLKHELARRVEARTSQRVYPRTPEVASRLGVEENELRALIHEHDLPVEKDATGRYFEWTDEAISAARALVEELASRPPQPEPPPPGLISKQVAARLKMGYESFIQFSVKLRKREPSLQPVLYKSTLYWRQEDVAVVEKALAEHRAKPEARQKYQTQEQKNRLARLREHAYDIEACLSEMELPEGSEAEGAVREVLALCDEIEAALSPPLTFISTLPVEGWSLRQPVSVWVKAVTGGFEAEVVDFDLRATASTRRGAIEQIRYALCRRYEELAQDPVQEDVVWIALRQLVVPPARQARRG